jgi:hypothetical protein
MSDSAATEAVEFADIDETQPVEAEETSSQASRATETSDAQIPPSQSTAESGEGDEPSRVEWPEDLLRSAGLTAEQASKSFKSADELDAAMKWHDAQMLTAGKQWHEQANLQQQQQMQQQQPPPVPATPQQAQQQTQALLDKLDLGLKAEEWDEQTINLVTKLNDHYHDRFTSVAQRNAFLEQAIQTVSGFIMGQAERDYVTQFDNLVNSLPETYAEVFGKGARSDLKENSKEFGERVRLNQAMSAIQRGRQVNGLPPLSTDQLFNRALRAEFGDIETKAIRQELNSKMETRQRQFTSRPTSRAGKQLAPETKAANRVQEFMAARGLSLAPDDIVDADGI